MKLILLGAMLLSSAFSTADGHDYPKRKSGIMDAKEWWGTLPFTVELPARNKVRILTAGSITWNGYGVSVRQLDGLMKRVAQQRPQHLTQLEWAKNAPCDAIEKVRSLMKKRLKCAGSRNCLEGADPRLPSPHRI